MDPDMNKYDLEHVTTGHVRMSTEDWQRAYGLAWKTYFTPDHIKTVMRRAAASGMSAGKVLFLMLWFHSCITLEKIHPLEGGYFRRKYRLDRRPGLPLESRFIFYPRYAWETVYKHIYLLALIVRYGSFRQILKRSATARNYTDLSLTPVADDEYNELEMFAVTDSAKAAVDKMRLKEEQREKRALAN